MFVSRNTLARFEIDARAILRLAGPLVVNNLVLAGMGVANTMAAGRVGPEALSGVAVGVSYVRIKAFWAFPVSIVIVEPDMVFSGTFKYPMVESYFLNWCYNGAKHPTQRAAEASMYERMMDKSMQPTDEDMVNWIGQPIAQEWVALRQFLTETYDIMPIFHSGGKRYGWNLQYRIGGRPLCEMYPEQGSFTVLVNLGIDELGKAMDRIEIFGALVRQAVAESPRYHDGCWMYMRVSDPLTCQQDVRDIEQLILIKKKTPRRKAAS